MSGGLWFVLLSVVIVLAVVLLAVVMGPPTASFNVGGGL